MINLNGIMSPHNHIDRAMGFIAVGAAVLSTGVGMYQANQNKQDAKGLSNAARAERNKQQAALNKQKEEYKAMKFENPFAGMDNAYSENVFEDLTVNQQQAQFQAQQGNQRRTDIMQGLKGAAGSSGIAGLAQAMANQGQLQTQRISASIGSQEALNQQLKARGAQQVQAGAAANQIAERQGDQFVQQAEMDRQATLLGMQMGEATGANQAFQQSQANQMNAQIAQRQVLTDGLSNIASTTIAAGSEKMFAGQK